MTSFISEVKSVVKQLKDVDNCIFDVAVISKIINSLSLKLEILVVVWDSVDPAKCREISKAL